MIIKYIIKINLKYKMYAHNIFIDGSNCICYMDRFLRKNGLTVNNKEISRTAFKKFRWDPYKVGDAIFKYGKHMKYSYKVDDAIIKYGKHMKYSYKDNMTYNMYFASSISCRFSQKLERAFNALGINTYRENHTNNDKEMNVDTYLHQSIINVSDLCNPNAVFYIVTGDVNEENKFNFPQLVDFLASKGFYVSILTPGRPHYKFTNLEKKYPRYVQVKSLSAYNIMSAMTHKNNLITI